MENILTNKFIIVPIVVVILVQISKIFIELIITKKWNLKKCLETGGMPSSHSAFVFTLSTLIGKYEGFNTSLYALSLVFCFIVVYDASHIRYEAGKHAKILNELRNEKLQENLGHTKLQVLVGSIIGIIVGLIF